MTFYLKYRPQSLDELIGQEQVKKTLLSAFNAGKLAHAYLFVGPRGTGKTSTARILAKMVNCENNIVIPAKAGIQKEDLSNGSPIRSGMTGQIPCNKCSTCLSITDGSNLDLIEIDAASNRGIDDIRTLRERIKLSPTASKKKVYIIDEVHMLTTEAFNALLKTLEEPPAHALFILATTEVQKVPQTIMSRVQRLDFNLAKPAELEQALSRIAKLEKIEIDNEALKMLIQRAEGSFRDGVKLLDQIASMGVKITVEVLNQSLKSTKFEEITGLIMMLSEKKTSDSLNQVTDIVEKGADIKDLLLSVMDTFRSLVFIKNGLGDRLVSPHLSGEKYLILTQLTEKFTNQNLVANLDVLQKAMEKLKFASIPALPLELAVVQMCESGNQIKSDEIRKSENQIDQKISVPVNQKKDSDTPIYRHTETLISSDLSGSSDLLKLKEKWTFVLETARQYNFSLEALLRSINVKECTVTTVIIEVPYAFHQRILEAPKNRELLESLFSEILGRTLKLVTALGVRPQRREDIVNIEVAQDDEIIRAAAEIFNSDPAN